MNPIHIQSKRRKLINIKKEFPTAEIIDVTSKGVNPFVKFSPFYPIGNIPVPYSSGIYSQSVEGIWQGLKVFQNHDVDSAKFHIITMKGLKRTVRKYGNPLGHRKGINSIDLLNYVDARKLIFIPTYKWVLKNKLQKEVDNLIKLAKQKEIVLLDYEVNGDVENTTKPLSHASLIKDFMIKLTQ